MAGRGIKRLGLLIRSGPWLGRSNRDQMDIAMAAVLMGMELELFFIGDGILQLLAGRDGRAAGLPPGHKAWSSLGTMGPVRAWTDAGSLQKLDAAGLELSLALEPADAAALRKLQGRCDRLLVL